MGGLCLQAERAGSSNGALGCAILGCLGSWLPHWHLRLCLCTFWSVLEGLRLLKPSGAPAMPEHSPPISHAGPRGVRQTVAQAAEKGSTQLLRGKGKNGLHTLLLCMGDVSRVLRVVLKACQQHRSSGAIGQK